MYMPSQLRWTPVTLGLLTEIDFEEDDQDDEALEEVTFGRSRFLKRVSLLLFGVVAYRMLDADRAFASGCFNGCCGTSCVCTCCSGTFCCTGKGCKPRAE